jgi:hypothetical protein
MNGQFREYEYAGMMNPVKQSKMSQYLYQRETARKTCEDNEAKTDEVEGYTMRVCTPLIS